MPESSLASASILDDPVRSFSQTDVLVMPLLEVISGNAQASLLRIVGTFAIRHEMIAATFKFKVILAPIRCKAFGLANGTL